MCHIYTMKETLEEKDELNLITLAQEYSDEDKARGLLESLLWPDGPVCPHCKNHKEKAIYKLESKARQQNTASQRSIQVRCLSQAVHRPSWNDFRGFAPANQQVAHGNFHPLLIQEIHQRTPTEPNA